jgi:hypothetical protein
VILGVSLCAAAGCGPARFLSQVNEKAAGAVAAAKSANAAELAPYEYTAACEYLHKAREEGAYAEYQIAVEYGRRSEELAVRARAVATERGLSGGGGQRAVEPPPGAKDSP